MFSYLVLPQLRSKSPWYECQQHLADVLLSDCTATNSLTTKRRLLCGYSIQRFGYHEKRTWGSPPSVTPSYRLLYCSHCLLLKIFFLYAAAILMGLFSSHYRRKQASISCTLHQLSQKYNYPKVNKYIYFYPYIQIRHRKNGNKQL